jgi:Phospholipase_D-nuclease N-terminal
MVSLSPLAILFRLFPFGIQGIAALAAIFWIWILIDCLTKEPADTNDKVAWVLVILSAPLIGALIYYFVRRPERIKAAGQ